VDQHYAGDAGTVPDNELEWEVADVYAKHAVELLKYATLILRQADGAGDAVQEVFLRYFAERKCGGSIENPRAWLYRVLYNHLMDGLRRASLDRGISSDCTAEFVNEAKDPEEILSRSQTARRLASALTGRELDCLRLRAEGLSYEEVAGALGIRSGTVGALLTRVHQKFRRAARGSPSLRMEIAGALLSLVQEGRSHSS
jgi:RNA polymerase sigma-70 factor (ECF subfamily)